MVSLMERIEREVLEGKLRAKNRNHEHADHGWVQIGRWTNDGVSLRMAGLVTAGNSLNEEGF